MSKEAIKLIKECLATKDPYLNLGNCGLTDKEVAKGTEIDDLLGQCTHLEKLILSNRWYESNKKEEDVLRNNSRKGFRLNKFIIHPPALEKLVNLSELICAGNSAGSFGISEMKFISFLPKLRYLDLSYNKISKIEGLDKLTNLNQLHLSFNKITTIEGLDKLTNLNQLDLSSNNFTKIEGLDKLTALNQLILDSSRITKIEGLDKLTALNELILFVNNITKIEGLDKLTALNLLNLWDNKITKIEGLDKLTALNLLNLWDNKITKIEGLDKLTALNKLYLGNNQITKLEGLDTLTALNKLDLSDNQITKIEGLDTLSALNELNLERNQITKIEGLSILLNRKDLYIDLLQNPLDEKYPFKLKERENHFPFIRDYLIRQEATEKMSVHYPVKVLVLGNHASGKSSLVNLIKGIKKKGSTHILRIENYFINRSQAKERILPDAIFFDFGGQDFYHGLYQAFISKGGLQLILFNTLTDNNYPGKDNAGYDIVHFNRHYWLGQKRYNDNSDPYIMVQTYMDMEGAMEATAIDYQPYTGYKKSFFLSLNNELNEAQKKEEGFYVAAKKYFTAYFTSLLKEAQTTQDYQEPKWYIDFLAFIINRKNTDHQPTAISDVLKNYNSDLPTEEKLDSLKINLTTMHRHGLVIYYDVDGLQDTVWLNPEKLVKHIQQKVLKKELIKNREGIISKTEFEKDVVNNEKNLLLLLKQKVVFLHDPTGQEKDKEYIIPNYLPLANENDPGYQLFVFGLQQPDFSIKFNDFIPFGFINQLTCFYGLQPDVKKFWRNQLLFTLNKEARVLIQIDFTSLQVKVYVQLLSNAKSAKSQVSTYLFYSLLALYWDRWDNVNILTYNEYLPLTYNKYLPPDNYERQIESIRTKGIESTEIFANKLTEIYGIWQTIVKDKSCVPPDAYLSVDGERFISYQALFELQGQYRLPAYLLKNGRIDKDSVKEIPVSPFAPFTHKKIAGIKKLFISYSHDDIAARQTLQQYLINLERDGLIEIWQDGLIQAGEDWDKKIKNSLASADICILLLSQSFIASNYSNEVEFKAIMEKRKTENTRIIPILLKDCDWKNWKVYPANVREGFVKPDPDYSIGSFQLLPQDNKRLKAISKWPHPEEAWLQVAEAIREFCENA